METIKIDKLLKARKACGDQRDLSQEWWGRLSINQMKAYRDKYAPASHWNLFVNDVEWIYYKEVLKIV